MIYDHMSDIQKNRSYPIRVVDYKELLAAPEVHASDISRFAELDPTRAELGAAVDFVRKTG